MINLNTYFSGLPTSDPITVAWWIFIHGGWIFAVLPALWAAWTSWLTSRKHLYEHNIRYVLLAIDVPKETEQSPRAVEQIFAGLAATYSRGTIYQRLWQGKHQESFSFEIVSLGGYIQFLIRAPSDYRDLIEASVYAQYPDAEITEVEDYVDRVPLDFDTDAYDLWGTEFALTKKDVYPIRTYPDFEHTLSGDFKDPMAALLEILSRINPDEDVWLQLLVTPCSDHWKAESAAEVKKIVEHKKHSGHGMLYWLFVELPMNTACVIVEIAFAGIFEPTWCGNEYSGGKEVEVVRDITKLTPGQKAVVEGIEHKASKIGFYSKLRLVYWGKRETFLKGRGVSAVVGAIQQFTALNMNGFVPGKRVTTKAEYFLKQSRINRKQKSILKSYKMRSAHRGLGHGVILNTEELASLYHFPIVTVKAPLVKKTETKKSEPPTVLPTLGGYLKPVSGTSAVSETGGKGTPPSNLPFVD
jgi:hypothetical protein